MTSELDKLISNEVDMTLNAEKDGEMKSNTNKSGLHILCNIFIVLGFILLIPTVIFFFMSFDKQRYLIPFVSCLAGCISLLFYGFVGNCLDDIRNNTKKK